MKASEIMYRPSKVRPRTDPVRTPPEDAEFTGEYDEGTGEAIWRHVVTWKAGSETVLDDSGNPVFTLNAKGERIRPRTRSVMRSEMREFIVQETSPGCNVLNYHFRPDPAERARIDRQQRIAAAQREMAEAVVDSGESPTEFVRRVMGGAAAKVKAAVSSKPVMEPHAGDGTPLPNPADPPPGPGKNPPTEPPSGDGLLSYREFLTIQTKEGKSMAEVGPLWREYKIANGIE